MKFKKKIKFYQKLSLKTAGSDCLAIFQGYINLFP